MARTEHHKRTPGDREGLCIEGLQNDFLVVRAHDVLPADKDLAIPAEQASSVLQFAFERRSGVDADLASLCEMLDGTKPWGFALPGEDEPYAVRRRIERALESGEIVALRLEARRVALLQELMELDAAEDSNPPSEQGQKPPLQEEKSRSDRHAPPAFHESAGHRQPP